MSPPAFEDMVTVGRVVKPQGRKGEVAVQALSDRPDRFARLERVFVRAPGGVPRELRVRGSWPHKGRFVLAIEGIDSIDAAETLRGLELRIPEDQLAPLPPGAYYHHQLVGLRVLATDGRDLGRVESLWETGGEAPVLVVRGAPGEILIPLAERFVRQVDLAGGGLVVDPPDTVVADAAL